MAADGGAATITSDSAMLTPTGVWRPASATVNARMTSGRRMLTPSARSMPRSRSDLRAMNTSRAKATTPIATASFAVPGTLPADSVA
jgi:hypothetical protein